MLGYAPWQVHSVSNEYHLQFSRHISSHAGLVDNKVLRVNRYEYQVGEH
jgi:hypothetical protein